MTLIYMILYEIKNRLHLSIYMWIMAIMAVVLIIGGVPIVEKAVTEGLKNTRFSVAFVDEEDSQYTQTVVNQVLKSPSIEAGFELLITNRKDALTMLAEDEIAAAIIIPDGFIEGMKVGHQKDIEVILNPKQALYANLVKGGMESGSYLMSAVQNVLYTFYEYTADLPISPDEVDKIFNIEMFSLISQAMNRDSMYKREVKTPWQNMEMADFYGISVILFFMALYSSGAIYQWHENGKRGLTRRMQFVCKHPIYVIYANIIANTVMIFVQGLMMLIPLFLIRHGISALRMMPAILLISLSIAALVMLFAVLIKHSTGAVITFVVFILFSGLVSGNLIPAYLLPQFIPSGLKNLSVNYYWQQLMINAYTNDVATQLKDGLIILGITGLIFLLLKGITSEKLRNNKVSMAK